jgi:hypothetical protein
MSFESRLRYFHLYQDWILEKLECEEKPSELTDEAKVDLANAYLEVMSEG